MSSLSHSARRDYEYEYEDECHKNGMMSVQTIQDKFGPEVPRCCDFHGYFDSGNCDGTDPKVLRFLLTKPLKTSFAERVDENNQLKGVSRSHEG